MLHFPVLLTGISGIIILIVYVRKLSLREVKWLPKVEQLVRRTAEIQPSLSFLFFTFLKKSLFYTGVKLINSFVLVSGIQQSNSVIHIHVSILFKPKSFLIPKPGSFTLPSASHGTMPPDDSFSCCLFNIGPSCTKRESSVNLLVGWLCHVYSEWLPSDRLFPTDFHN